MRDQAQLCWLRSTSVLKRDSFHPRISPVRSVFSRLLTRVSQPAGRPWLSRSWRLFRLFPKCNSPFAQVWPAFTCYAAVCSEAVLRCAGYSTFNIRSWTRKKTRRASLSRSMVQLSAPWGAPASRLASVPEPGASCDGSALPWYTCRV